METTYNETLVAELAAAEKQVQQAFRPIIGVHKWFARRPGSLFRALALSELDDRPLSEHYFQTHDLDGVCLDPFMGGGSAMWEANRVGLSVVGYDTNPMSRWLVERELEELDVALFEAEAERVAAAVEAKTRDLYETDCEECGGTVPVKSWIWVKTHTCDCGHTTHLFPGPVVAGRGMKRHTHDVLVCGSCLHVHQFLPDENAETCPSCGSSYADMAVPAKTSCVCGRAIRVGVGNQPPAHALIALEYHCEKCKAKAGRRGRFFKGADERDHARFAEAQRRYAEIGNSPHWPDDEILPGDETNRLLKWGYRRWRDLHNERQLYGLALLADEIAQADERLRPALATVFSDFLRYQNMICRYDTAALKVLDVFSIHGFPINRIQCEAALVGIPGVGSGAWRHFVAKYAAAKRYCEQPFETVREQGRKRKIAPRGERIAAEIVENPGDLSHKRSALLRCASLAAEPLPDGVASMVLTDPPYYANVAYSELMDFPYAWLRRLMPDTSYFTASVTRSEKEATGSKTHGRGIDEYAQALSAVYQAAARALRPGGPFVFTYHHQDLLSYAALIVAVLDAGLVPITTLACPSEMRGSIHISNAGSSRVDSVFVLRKPPVAVADDHGMTMAERLDRHAENLLAAGLAVTPGDQRCIRFGLLAEDVMRKLAPRWDASAPINTKMQAAREVLTALDEERPAGDLVVLRPASSDGEQLAMPLAASR